MRLNMEQRKLIEAKPNGHAIIKGVAGSGKTTVAVYKIPFLLNHYCFGKDDRVLMVTYNKTLINYIQYLYEKVEEDNKYRFDTIFNNTNEKIEISTIDSLLFKYYVKYLKENNLNYQLVNNNNEKYTIMAEVILALSKKYERVKYLDQKYIQFIIDEIDWIKACNYMELEEYLSADRLGRMNTQGVDGPQRLMKNSDTRQAIFEAMILYNEKLRQNNRVDFKDMALMALEQAKKKVDTKYTHILVDESQDLTRVQLEFLKLLYNEKPYSSFYFIADTAQSIYPHSWLVKGRSFTSIGFDMTGKSNSLSKNYRTTAQIAEAAYSLIKEDPNIVEDENFVKPSLIDRQGQYPIYRWTRNQSDEAQYVINEIKKLLCDYNPKDIAIIAKNKGQLNYLKGKLEVNNMPCDLIDKNNSNFEDESIKLLTMHSIKGLEFKVVMIIGLNEGIIPYVSYMDVEDTEIQETSDRKLLYVGMTRANELLYMTSSGKPSKFIKEMNFDFLKLKNNTKIRHFYNISIDDYLFKNRIVDLYSKEERVRQWFIKELCSTYKYPLDLIDVEYKVNNFSRVGSVDIVVNIYKNNTIIPYIFIETKSLCGGLQHGLEQLKSYMSNSKTCQYGVVTDGNELVIINRDFEEVDDIPLFHTSMLPSSIESFTYIDCKHRRNYEIIRDGDRPFEITLKNDIDKQEYNEDNLKQLYIYGDIAAGQPILINEDRGQRFYLPKEWVKGPDDFFILKIKGDSMIDANIEDGDYVVIKKQPTAENREIAAVDIDGHATLKRIMLMGDTILLIPENKNYEPIHMKREHTRIIGVVQGIIKRNR